MSSCLANDTRRHRVAGNDREDGQHRGQEDRVTPVQPVPGARVECVEERERRHPDGDGDAPSASHNSEHDRNDHESNQPVVQECFQRLIDHVQARPRSDDIEFHRQGMMKEDPESLPEGRVHGRTTECTRVKRLEARPDVRPEPRQCTDDCCRPAIPIRGNQKLFSSRETTTAPISSNPEGTA